MAEKTTTTVKTLDQIAREAGLSQKDVVPAIRRFNRAAKRHDRHLSDRTIYGIANGEIRLRNSNTIAWYRAFITAMTREKAPLSDEDLDAYFAALPPQVAKAPEPATSAVFPDGPDLEGLRPELLAFSRLLSAYEANNSSIRKSHHAHQGFYRVIRATTDPQSPEKIHVEPLYFGKLGDVSWLLPSNGQAVASGFSTASDGVGIVVLLSDQPRAMGFMVVMILGEERAGDTYQTGLVLRYSEQAKRPVAMRVLLERVTDEEVTGAWKAAFADGASSDDIAPTLRPGDVNYAFYEQFELHGGFTKSWRVSQLQDFLYAFNADPTDAPGQDQS